MSARARIIRNGITIFLDTLGKKKGSFYLKISGTDVQFPHRKDKQNPQQQPEPRNSSPNI